MEEMEELQLIERKYLTNHNRGKKLIDIPYVYAQIDKGRPLGDIAKELGVCRSTIYRRHREYQAAVAALLAVEEPEKVTSTGELPPLPEEIS